MLIATAVLALDAPRELESVESAVEDRCSTSSSMWSVP